MSLPTLVYAYMDASGQNYVSVDIMLLSGMRSTGIVPKISKCGNFLDVLIEVPLQFFAAQRLMLAADDVKACSLVSQAHTKMSLHGRSEDTYRVWLTQTVKLPFQVQQQFSRKYNAEGYETIQFQAGDLSDGTVCTIDMIATKVAILPAASPPVRRFGMPAQMFTLIRLHRCIQTRNL